MPLNIKDLKITSEDFQPLGKLRDEHAGDKGNVLPKLTVSGVPAGAKDLAVICHGNGSTERLAASDLPAVPHPSDAENGCPLCAGLTTAFAIADQAQAPTAPVFYARAHTFRHVQFVVSDLTETRHPPSRGPPAIV